MQQRLLERLKRHARTFDLFPEYAKAVYSRWNDYFFEALLLSPIVIWWMLGSPPVWLVAWAFVIALIVAGYYAWRADHIRLMPKLEFAPQVFTEPNMALTINTNRPYPVNYIQVLPRCCTDAPVEQCRGRLLRVLKWNGQGWEPTSLNEPLDLIWSFHDSSPITLEPGIDQRLNILAITMNGVGLQVAQPPIKAGPAFSTDQDFRFDVRVTGKDCPPIDTSVRIRIDGQRTISDLNEERPLSSVVGIIDRTDGIPNSD